VASFLASLSGAAFAPVVLGTSFPQHWAISKAAVGGGSAPVFSRPYTDLGVVLNGATAVIGLSNDSVYRLESMTAMSGEDGATITIEPNAADIAAIPAGQTATAVIRFRKNTAANIVAWGGNWGSIAWRSLDPINNPTGGTVPPPLTTIGAEIVITMTVTPDGTLGSWQ